MSSFFGSGQNAPVHPPDNQLVLLPRHKGFKLRIGLIHLIVQVVDPPGSHDLTPSMAECIQYDALGCHVAPAQPVDVHAKHSIIPKGAHIFQQTEHLWAQVEAAA